ncbi:hypothetical protein [Sphingomonas morindae]|uniref:Uncharacterized protein n=1 Tax=Sphingomonas morindae TaxID=1541170 RepID=A0ABY4X3P9_9SPHN|nr:hypothetical protein [Sphingomonas morindae]USI71462.1 hypothetical protein LHA26_08915 [Sphingomonas morindae]
MDQKPIPRDPHGDDLDAVTDLPTPGQSGDYGRGPGADAASAEEAADLLGGPERKRAIGGSDRQPFKTTQGGVIGD